MPRTRTTKKLAQRIDLDYFKRPAPLRRWKFWLSVAAPALALAALGWHAARGDARAYSAGALAPAHALLTSRCEACHIRSGPGAGLAQPIGGGFNAKASDSACLACHDGAPHHADAAFTPNCASCHIEHRGAVRLAATADAACTQCHGDLRTRAGTTAAFVRDAADRQITSFTSQHPEFAVLRSHSAPGEAGSGDPTTIKLNHFRHMQPNLAGPNGPVQLACDDCHRTAADTRPWPYAGANAGATSGATGGPDSAAAADASTSSAASESRAEPSVSATGYEPSRRAYMGAPTYENACAGCHTLEFDKRFSEGVPHEKPEVVHAFLAQKFQSYIAAHPAELREPRQPDRSLPEQPITAAYRIVTPSQWVVERTAEAEELLWRKTCNQCHLLIFRSPEPASGSQATQGSEDGLPAVAPSKITVRFMPDARFDHSAHELVTCESCHAKASSSQSSADLLLPGIATCRECHRDPSGVGRQTAESRCFECHTYHDQSQWRPAPGQLTLPGLAPRPISFFSR